MRLKCIDSAVKRAAEREALKALDDALHMAREEQQSDEAWMREQGKSFVLGFVSACLLGLMVYLIVHGVMR